MAGLARSTEIRTRDAFPLDPMGGPCGDRRGHRHRGRLGFYDLQQTVIPKLSHMAKLVALADEWLNEDAVLPYLNLRPLCR
jgi:hypothetical protein